MTLIGNQTDMMVHGPGGYRCVGSVRFGAPLDLPYRFIGSLSTPFSWPF